MQETRMPRHSRWIYQAPLALVALHAAVAAPAGGDAPPGLNAFTPEAYIDKLKVLASDGFEGRGTGQEGNNRAAQWIADRVKEAGLKPAGVDGTYFQPFEVKQGRKLDEAAAALETPGLDRAWKLREDWIPLPFSKSGDAEGPVAFAGYGIEAPEFKYDDFGDFDVKDKILLVFRYEPRSDDPKADFGGDESSKHALFTTKASTAHRKGAKALIVVSPPLREPKDEKLYPFDDRMLRTECDIPMIHVTAALADALLAQAGAPSVAELQKKLDEERRPMAMDLKGVTAKIRPGVVTNMLKTQNVCGLLEGESGTGDVIVCGAHFDHLGIAGRGFGGSSSEKFIHNGADDNASGTTGVLELVRVLAQGPKLRRSILFITFSGEEMGLLGSKHWCKEPTIPLEHVRAMVNLDMIGRLREDKFLIYGLPSAPEFKAIVDRASQAAALPYKPAKSIPGNSDHASFQAKKIPVLFPFTGLHRQYHKPDDDWELINADGAVRVLRMTYLILTDLANLSEGPTWQDPKKAEAADEEEGEPPKDAEKDGDKNTKQPAADPHAAANRGGDDAPPKMPTVRLGISPDYAGGDKPGLRVETVTPEGIAAKAGVKDGDRIVKLGDYKVKDIVSYMEALGNFKAGDEIDIVVERDGQTVTLKATLTAPPAPAKKE